MARGEPPAMVVAALEKAVTRVVQVEVGAMAVMGWVVAAGSGE